ncbi:chaperonin 10-like protein [Mycena vulgaris]|nr:chaperonin 10-like protein [Mycena vulgaris]
MIPTTMLAAVYVPGNERLVLDKNYPIRELADNEVLLKVAAAGVCHTDVALLSGVSLDTRKYMMGHEGCGFPVKLGAKVDGKAIQKEKLYCIFLVDSCLQGMASASALFNTVGIGKDGSYAEYIIATEETLVPVPTGVPPGVAAIASDAGLTAYHAVQHSAKVHVKSGDKVLIFGIGGLGHLAVQYAKHFGATVYVCDFKPAARKLALELGATEAFDLIVPRLTSSPTLRVRAVSHSSQCHSSPLLQAFNLAMAALRGNEVKFPSSPRLVLVHWGSSIKCLWSARVLIISCSTPSTLLHLECKVRHLLNGLGTVQAHVHSEPLENVNKVIDELRAFEITGRKVVIPHSRA